MLFVSNNHVLCQFLSGQFVTLLSNGSIVHQKDPVADHFGVNSVVVGESVLEQGKKLVLLEKSEGEGLKNKKFIVVNFGQDGEASEQGVFEDYREEMKKSALFDEIQYVKEYFVTQNDEVIKIAAICPKETELVSIESFKN